MHTMYMSQPAPAASGPYPSIPAAAAGNGVGGAGGWGPNSQDEPQITTLSFFYCYFGVISNLENSQQSSTQHFSDSLFLPLLTVSSDPI